MFFGDEWVFLKTNSSEQLSLLAVSARWAGQEYQAVRTLRRADNRENRDSSLSLMALLRVKSGTLGYSGRS